ncbi:alpha/beta hydrolase [Thiotrichales bacterium 19S3-7]|nr:alpha/beta hydrolase [Thiotrichales bacterium 19S3-7]MCF6801077.1 alpha/beta hydrolase [Thiotrichales bacterium 19S3-11]
MLDYITKRIGDKAKYAVIWLHGLGADGHDFESILPELNLPVNADIEFIFPHAPIRAITINGGYQMRGWYDIRDMGSIDNHIDFEGIRDSITQMNQLIEQVIDRGVASENIILAGFSQGGAIATLTMLFSTMRFGGLIALSTYLPGFNELKSHVQLTNQSIPITIAHGLYDPIVPIQAGEHLYHSLTDYQFQPTFHHYEVEHGLCLEEIKMIRAFICQTFQLKLETL